MLTQLEIYIVIEQMGGNYAEKIYRQINKYLFLFIDLFWKSEVYSVSGKIRIGEVEAREKRVYVSDRRSEVQSSIRLQYGEDVKCRMDIVKCSF